MTNYPRSAYGANPNSGKPANGDRAAWGGFAWPNGVPAGLTGVTDYTSSFGQRLRVQMRKEIVPLWNLLFELIDRKHRYQVWAVKSGEVWGPWGYANRAVAGSSTPSGHSMALSVDINAPFNPYSYTFQSDMPPAMVADLESCGLYWGGRYTGKADAMHYGYCFGPGSVAGHINRARMLLGKSPAATPPATTKPTQPKDWSDMASKAEVEQAVADAIKKATPAIVDAVWNESVNYNRTDQKTGKITDHKGTMRQAQSAAASYGGYAAWNSKHDDQK